MKKLLLGNEAVARGLYEAGVKVVSSYPGTPSTEITEYASLYDEMYSEWASNEKVAMEVAFGASVAGARAFTAMKHVGLNVAADPLFTLSYTGVSGGLVIAVADDPGMHSSQNEQDSRHYALAAKVPMLEPADSCECLYMTKLAYELSERFDTPVMIRLTTRISHGRSLCETSEREERELKPYVKNPQKYVMMPAMAKKRHIDVEQRLLDMAVYGEDCAINTIENNDTAVGVITSGACYQYARETLGDSVSYLKLGMVFPMPQQLIREFCSQYETVYVIEELDDFIETHCKKLGLNVIGKERFPVLGELNQNIIREQILGQLPQFRQLDENIPVRPPVLCPGCPHRGLFYALKTLNTYVSGDIGCYTLSSLPPLGTMDICLCMGASVSSLHGANLADPDRANKRVAVLGDSTFIHSGITGLIDIAYNHSISTVIILDNSITGMTGHQQNPTTGLTIKNEPASAVSLEKLCDAVGIRKISIVDPHDLELCMSVLREHLCCGEPNVVIARRPCALLKSVKPKPALYADCESCKGCKACMRIGCPAISLVSGKAQIDAAQCVGCGLCRDLCKFGAIGCHK